MKSKQLYHFLSSYVLKYKKGLIIGFICIVFTTLFQLISPWILRYGIKFVEFKNPSESDPFFEYIKLFSAAQEPSNIILGYGVFLVFFKIFEGLFRYLMRMILIGSSRRMEYDLRNDYFRHLQSLSQSFYNRHKTGDLMARATNDLDAVRSMLGPGIMHLLTTLLVSIAAIALMFNIHITLTLWALLPLPFVALLVNRLLARINIIFGKIQEQFSNVTSKVQENLAGIRVIKSYVQSKHEINDFKIQNQELIKRNLDLAKIRATLGSSIEALLALGVLFVIWLGGIKVIENQLSIGDLVAFLAYISMLAWPMIAFGWVINLWQQGLASTQRIMNIFEEEPDIHDSHATDFGIDKLQGEIEFKNVHFKYSRDGENILKGINLKIPTGQTLAIVGPTGSGKTTLVNLIPRLYDTTKGTLLIDGRDIRVIPLHTLRKNIGFVPQETFLFSVSIKENIAYGMPDISIHQIEEATQTSQINVDLQGFPEGLETMIGERGITLSGGQKQRASMSRAIIRKPKILVLDDALSAVDTYTEEEILKRLRLLMQNRTSIIISHRISTIRDADQIIVLQDGCISEKGKHEELLAQKGFYYRLYQRQLLEESLKEYN